MADDDYPNFSVAPNVMTQGVDPDLINTIKNATQLLPKGYKAQITSGNRPGDPRFHGQGMAVDVQLIDPSGKPVPNYQTAQAFSTYERFAQNVHALQPQYAPNSPPIRWGGYFPGPKGLYGAVDLMHFDTGLNGQMGGGTWEHGLAPEQRKLWPNAGSVGLHDPDPEAMTALAAIGGGQPKPPANALALTDNSPAVDSTPKYSGDLEKDLGITLPQAAAPPKVPTPTAAGGYTGDLEKDLGVTLPGGNSKKGPPADAKPGPNGLVWNTAGGYDPQTGELVIAGKPMSTPASSPAVAATTGVLSGVPVVGPAILGGVERGVAAAKSLANGGEPQLTDRNGNPIALNQSLAGVKDITQQSQADYPKTTIGANLIGGALGYGAGAIAAPGALGLTGSLGTRAAVGGASNAAIGAADAYMRGNNPLIGATVGGVLGGAAPLAGQLIGQGVSKLGNVVNKVVQSGNPALNMLAGAVRDDGPQAVADAASRYGDTAMLADLGPSLGGLAQGLAPKPGAAKSLLFNNLTARAKTDNQFVNNAVEGGMGPAEDPSQITEAIKAHRAAVDAVNYPAAMANAPPIDTTEPLAIIAQHLTTAVGKQRTALTNLRDMLMTVGPDGKPLPVTDAQTLHNVKSEAYSVINHGAPGLGVEAGAVARQQGSLKAVSGALNGALEEQIPGYAEANAAHAALSKRAEAVEEGYKLFDPGNKQTPAAFDQTFGMRDPGEQVALAKGARAKINQVLGTKANDPAALRALLQGEGGWNTDRAATVFGQEPTNALVNVLEAQSARSGTMNNVIGNSQTAQRQGAAKLLADTNPQEPPNLMGTTLTGALATAGRKFIYNPLVHALTAPNYGPRDLELARMLTAQGAAREAVYQDAVKRAGMQNTSSAVAGALGTGADQGANLLTRAITPESEPDNGSGGGDIIVRTGGKR